MLNTLFLNVHLTENPNIRKIRLSGTAPSKRVYQQDKKHLEYWMNQPLSDDEYASLQHYLSIPDINPIEYFTYGNEFSVERKYRHKSSLDSYFFYLKNRVYQRAFSAHYTKHQDTLIRVDRKNCFAHIAKTMIFPHPHHLQFVTKEHPSFNALLHNDISGMIYAVIEPKVAHCSLLQKYHPFKVHLQEHYQTFFWRQEKILALISKEEWKIYQQYMEIEPLWIIGSTIGAPHPLLSTLNTWQDIREQHDGVLKDFAKTVILNTVSYGSRHHRKRQTMETLNDMNIAHQFSSDSIPLKHHSFFQLHGRDDHFSCKYIDIYHTGSFFMWNHLIQAAATADMFQHMANIHALQGIVHYANVDSLHFSIPENVSYTFPSHWKIEDNNIDEAIWFTAGRWATRKDDKYHFTGFPKTEQDTLILEVIDGQKMMWNAFNLPAQRHWKKRTNYVEWGTFKVHILATCDEQKMHEFRRRFMAKFKQTWHTFKSKDSQE